MVAVGLRLATEPVDERAAAVEAVDARGPDAEDVHRPGSNRTRRLSHGSVVGAGFRPPAAAASVTDSPRQPALEGGGTSMKNHPGGVPRRAVVAAFAVFGLVSIPGALGQRTASLKHDKGG